MLLITSLTSYSQFKISGQIRPRMEYRNGYKTLRNADSEMAASISQRTRISMNYEKEKLKTGISFYDFRIWGDQKLKKDIPSIGLLEAWADLYLSKTISLKIGRQQISYDNSRLMSAVNWNQIGAAHDVLLFKFRKSGWIMDIGMAYNQANLSNFGMDYSDLIDNYKSLNFLWLKKKFGKLTISTLNILDGYQKEGTTNTVYFRITYGGIIDYKNTDIQFTARGFGQRGKIKTGVDVNAYYLNSDISYSLNNKIKLYAGFELISGNNATDNQNTTDNAFDILYGARHKFNGRIDYFSVPSTTKGAGLINPYMKVTFKLNNKLTLNTYYHYFMLHNDYLDVNSEKIDKFLGHEIDLTLDIKFSKEVSLQSGYSVMFGTNSMEVIKGGDKDLMNNWFFIMLTIKPTFFSDKLR